jgi:hypothetical protein
MKQQVAKKGYTITVDSWENDGDYSQTHSITVDSKEKAKAYHDLMQLCVSKNNRKREDVKLGNTYGSFSEKQEEVINDFLKENPILLDEFGGIDLNEEEGYTDIFRELTYPLLGSSENYSCRVMESCTVTYSPEDIFIEIENIKF